MESKSSYSPEEVREILADYLAGIDSYHLSQQPRDGRVFLSTTQENLRSSFERLSRIPSNVRVEGTNNLLHHIRECTGLEENSR